MVSDIIIQKKNEVYLLINAEPHIKQELTEYFTFEVPDAKFMPQYKAKIWDGKIRLFSPGTGELYCGLLQHVKIFAEERNYSIELIDNKFYGHPEYEDKDITPQNVVKLLKKFNITLEIRDYQYRGIYEALKKKRKLLLSPTGSGKSLMIYSIVRFLEDTNHRTLIIVPTTSLVEQIFKDFISYGWEAPKYCHKIYSGKEKLTNAPVVITTWQSIYKLPKKYFDDFTAVIGDEAHLFKAKSLTSVLTKLHQAEYRIGFTGTLDGTKTHKLVLEGLFGPVEAVTKTDNLIKKGYLASLQIKILLLKHEHQTFNSYQEEINYIISNEKRNNLIKNLVKDLEGNTLVLFAMVERHGMILYDLINNAVGNNRKVFFVYGGVDVDERENIRQITETQDNAIIIASYGTFSTGINIKNLHNVVFASPSKSRVRNLQSIGRVLRVKEGKTHATLYDIADDISKNNHKNYTLNHLIERIKTYNEENFNYEIIDIKLKN
jgi:superfamily II DNA or RNA helicase